MNVSTEQIEAIERGEAVQVTVEKTDCVIVRRDVFERLVDDSEPNPDEAHPAVLEAWDSAGSPDDATDYQ